MPLGRRTTSCIVVSGFLALAAPLLAQDAGALRGGVAAADGRPVRGATVEIVGSHLIAFSDVSGQFLVTHVPLGPQQLRVTAIGFRPLTTDVTVDTVPAAPLRVVLEELPIVLGDIVVQAPSRIPERVVEAPAAVSVTDMAAIPAIATTGQLPMALAAHPGIDLAETDVHDFNVNARGFNSSLTRRVLVLQDGRDLAIPFLGSQEWSGLSMPLDDIGRIEMVRGPGSALYGANAFSGVLSITTPAAREVVGTKLSAGGGDPGVVRGDARQAGLLAGGRVGYKFNVGYTRNPLWAISRTQPGDLAREYAEAIDTARYPVVHPFPGFELRPLRGQQLEAGLGSAALGTADDEQDVYGGARVDYYAPNGSVLTAEAGAARASNNLFVTAVGRVQVDRVDRPWARLAWGADRFYLMAWWTDRHTGLPEQSLASGTPIIDQSHVFHLEAQTNQPLLGGKGRIVLGGSVRSAHTNSKETLLGAADDQRNDRSASAYTQVEYSPAPEWRLVAAGRFDDGDLFPAQLSPKAAIVYSPSASQSVRLTVNRAYKTPNVLEYFIQFPAGAPADFSAIEAGLRASPLGPSLAAVPDGTLFTNSARVPVVARGNPALDVEHVTSYELGWKGQFGPRVFLTLDGYYSRLSNFVTDILPGVNPTYGSWSAPDAVPADSRAAVEQAVQDILIGAGQPVAAAGLSRLQDGGTAIVFSIGNAGRVSEHGFETTVGLQLTDALSLDVNYSLFRFSVDTASLASGQVLKPNTSANAVNVGLAYTTPQLDARAMVHVVEGFDWASGVYLGRIPSRSPVDVSLGWQARSWLNVHGAVTNLLDQRRYQVFGGSVIGRRALVGMTVVR
jgi:outer membrane receptor protein involved in Fe transport